ncbi:50S ribosomal protein L6 [Christensenella timonensis]|uniref:50S ribosomal protein L6 n=1 Tax=Christensenella timonensis TaxID=1816678 RepID=UPI000830E7DB|nr:50S ribosomal protein L6 [Christensenella timonensis]
MSRIGKLPIDLPSGVTVSQADGEVTVKGKNGELKSKFDKKMTISQEGEQLIVTRADDTKQSRALHGLTRALLQNMVTGVSEGFSKTLEIVGVGYRVQLSGTKLVFGLGYSHPVEVEAPAGITFEVPNPNTVIIKGINKQHVGQCAANIRTLRPPEPYKGKGIKYQGEYIRRKVGKTGM